MQEVVTRDAEAFTSGLELMLRLIRVAGVRVQIDSYDPGTYVATITVPSIKGSGERSVLEFRGYAGRGNGPDGALMLLSLERAAEAVRRFSSL